MACASNPTNDKELAPAPEHLVAKAAVAPALIEVTEKAAKKASALMAKRGITNGALRVKVLNGGCSGMSYNLEPTAEPAQSSDSIIEAHGLKVFLDAKSLLYLVGTTLDYESTLMSQRFVFKNPNATETCSCGESFTVNG